MSDNHKTLLKPLKIYNALYRIKVKFKVNAKISIYNENKLDAMILFLNFRIMYYQ